MTKYEQLKDLAERQVSYDKNGFTVVRTSDLLKLIEQIEAYEKMLDGFVWDMIDIARQALAEINNEKDQK
jgi:hypothetical protein